MALKSEMSDLRTKVHAEAAAGLLAYGQGG
jgi:hypothetical protein